MLTPHLVDDDLVVVEVELELEVYVRAELRYEVTDSRDDDYGMERETTVWEDALAYSVIELELERRDLMLTPIAGYVETVQVSVE